MYKKLLLLLVFSAIVFSSWAQPDFTLPSLRRVYQSTYINPAFKPKYKVSVGIPILSSIYINNTRTGFTLNDVTESIEDSLLNLNTFYTKIKGDFVGVATTFNTDIFHVSFPAGSFQLSFNSTFKTYNFESISKDFIGFAANGNSFFKGQNQSFKALEVNTISYVENGFSLSRQFNKFSVGVRAKYLYGIALVQTKDIRLGVATPQNNFDPITISSGGQINTAGLPLLGDSVNGQANDPSLKTFKASNFTKFNNNGFAVDLGATYQVLPNLMLHASVIDWGGIKWKGTPYNYKLQNSDIQFGGFNRDHLNSDSARANYVDSLVSLLGKMEVTNNSFSTTLNTRYTLGGDFDLTKRDRIGFLFQGQQTPLRFEPAYTFSYSHKFGVNWDVITNWSIFNKSLTNIGVGTAIKMGACQLYVLSDNVLIFFAPNTQNTLYFRIGLNLVWSQLQGSHISSGE